MTNYSKSLLDSLCLKIKDYPRFSPLEIEKFCWMAAHEHKHGVLPSEYDIRDEIKKINVSINGETLRVTSKSKNDLQLAIKLLDNLEETYKIPLEANNYR